MEMERVNANPTVRKGYGARSKAIADQRRRPYAQYVAELIENDVDTHNSPFGVMPDKEAAIREDERRQIISVIEKLKNKDARHNKGLDNARAAIEQL